jgi:hypothetical protein
VGDSILENQPQGENRDRNEIICCHHHDDLGYDSNIIKVLIKLLCRLKNNIIYSQLRHKLVCAKYLKAASKAIKINRKLKVSTIIWENLPLCTNKLHTQMENIPAKYVYEL